MSNLVFIFILLISSMVKAEFFSNISNIIENNNDRLSYGISVTDFDKDGSYEFIVAGFGYSNLALSYKNGKLINTMQDPLFIDEDRSTIGVSACDIDQDGFEEIYFLNTDTYSGEKKYSDRLLDNNNKIFDYFGLEKNLENLNLTAGRSVVCVDRNGSGKYGIYVANYGGPTRFYEIEENEVEDLAPMLGIDQITGGRAVISGHIVSDNMDIFAANERGPNFLYKNSNGSFNDIAIEKNVQDTFQNGRGTALTDFLYRGELDIITSNWEGYHRIFVKQKDSFLDMSSLEFRSPSRIRTVISADFDNDGYDEIFLNNIGQPNKLFRILDEGNLEEIELDEALEAQGLGTGAAVADIDNDGILELLISHGESGAQPLSLFKSNVSNTNFIRIKPLNTFGAPARGATVTLHTNLRNHAKTIDAGSGYLCQMEPVAHYGLREGEVIKNVSIKWTNGTVESYEITDINNTFEFKQGI
ncbi:FG-GAP-like repeat-containing protein [Pelagibacteraceae bacterium]|nr:FG-GAP-like repeat-containing protein [Pelagibacteraceae bacterium]